MKKLNKWLLALLAVCLLATPVLAAANTVQKNLTYRDIKLVIDGKEIKPTDVNGNSTEPFIIEGTTYLPVRAIGEALGYDVKWDGATSTVTLAAPGTEPAGPALDGTGRIEYFIEMQYASKADRDAYLEEAKAADIEKLSQEEKGNIRYEYMLSTANDTSIFLVEQWESAEDQTVHKDSAHYKAAMELRDKYVKNSVVYYLGYADLAFTDATENKIEYIIEMQYASRADRDAYLEEAKAADIEKLSQAEKGNIRYEYMLSTANDTSIYLVEQWESLADQTVHKDSAHYKAAMELRDKYVKNSVVGYYEFEVVWSA